MRSIQCLEWNVSGVRPWTVSCRKLTQHRIDVREVVPHEYLLRLLLVNIHAIYHSRNIMTAGRQRDEPVQANVDLETGGLDSRELGLYRYSSMHRGGQPSYRLLSATARQPRWSSRCSRVLTQCLRNAAVASCRFLVQASTSRQLNLTVLVL